MIQFPLVVGNGNDSLLGPNKIYSLSLVVTKSGPVFLIRQWWSGHWCDSQNSENWLSDAFAFAK